MAHIIAMAGKGGTGKTTVASLIVRIIKENKLGSVLAVDADPNSNLGESLGITAKENIGAILDDLGSHPENIPVNMGKDAFIDCRVQQAIEEGDGFDLLVMGRPEGPGCYCYVNNALRNAVAKLLNNYDYVVIDNEAGLEHLSRRTTRKADSMVVVSDASLTGLKAAKNVADLAKELKIRIEKSFLVINRLSGFVPDENIKRTGLEYLGALPLDPGIEKISQSSGSLMGLGRFSPSIEAFEKLGDKIWQRSSP
jgi:CO dehydrogenase maturation factor